MRFDELNLIDPLLRAIREQNYTQPTPIQIQAIPHVLAGRDLIGLAQTGTGKTAAFALPVLQRLLAAAGDRAPMPRGIRVLVVAPTRELAAQIGESFDAYGKYTPIKQATIFGGVSQNPQVEAVRRGINVLVATPGRLLDLMNQGLVSLNSVEILVLDEADRMLDMGFLPDIKRIIQRLPAKRQNLLFSATMPPDIQKLANSILVNPVEVAVTPESTTVETVTQRMYFVEKTDKLKLLLHLLDTVNMHRTLVFTRTKHLANRLAQQLNANGVSAAAIHGNKSQNAREAALSDFKRGKIQVLVATDIAARGIDIDDISHVVNFDLPNESESYVHRIGRTGRAGARGIALSFCAADEREYLTQIERRIHMRIPVVNDHPYHSNAPATKPLPQSALRHANYVPAVGPKPTASASNTGGGGEKSASRKRRRSRNRKPTPQP